MRKKHAAALLLTAALAVSSAASAFAASPTSGDRKPTPAGGGGSSYAGGTTAGGTAAGSSSTVSVNADGVKTTGAVTGGTAGAGNGSSIAIALDTKTQSGKAITVNNSGEAVVEGIAISFAKGDSATNGLPSDVTAINAKINSGENLEASITADRRAAGVDLTGYNALTSTNALLTKDNSTGAIKDVPTETTIYVPNLTGNLGEVALLYFNNQTGRYEVIPVTRVDLNSKLIYATVPGSGTFSVIYKR